MTATALKARWHADNYNDAFPDRVPLAEAGGMVGGCWMIGSCYRNPNGLYGAYPHGYLDRVHSMFPDAKNILHVFSGGLTLAAACEAAPGCKSIELVDLGGEGRHPTTYRPVETLPAAWAERFDLVLADPPYSKEDAETHYGVPMYNSRRVMTELHRVTKPGGNLVWLDQKWPMHTKREWKAWGTIGLVRSTQHRMRLVSFFRRVAP